jgi:precorrin-6A synthase
VRKLLLIGIGAGDPGWLTLEAVAALQAVDVFFALEKASEQDDLAGLRREVLARHVSGTPRVVSVEDPPRGRSAEAVAEWRRRRTELVAGLVRDELADGQTGGLLIWGDPTLYDGMRDVVAACGVEYRIVPGISAVSALAARHRIALNRVGGGVQITTGRRLADGWPDGVDDLVVMLDSSLAFMGFDADIYWGAYLGTPDELLISGRVADVGEEIARVRAEARTRKGWMFDTYLLRR